MYSIPWHDNGNVWELICNGAFSRFVHLSWHESEDLESLIPMQLPYS